MVRQRWVHRKAAAGLILIVAVAMLGAWMRPRLFPSQHEKARAAYDQGDWSSAATCARQILREGPNDAEALRLLARAYSRLGRDERHRSYSAASVTRQCRPKISCCSDPASSDRTEPSRRLPSWKRLGLHPKHPESLHELARLYAAGPARERRCRCRETAEFPARKCGVSDSGYASTRASRRRRCLRGPRPVARGRPTVARSGSHSICRPQAARSLSSNLVSQIKLNLTWKLFWPSAPIRRRPGS